MNVRRPLSRLSARLALLLVLLLAQGFLLAHEVDHIAAAESSLCAVCQVGHGLDSPAVAEAALPPAASDESVPFACPAPHRSDSARHARRARAPPLALSA